MKPRIPPDLYKDRYHLYGVFSKLAEELGDPQPLAAQLIRLMPELIRKSAVFEDGLTGVWRYDFGRLFDRMPNGQTVIGTHQLPQVRHLYWAMRAANRFLSEQQILGYLRRLEDPSKHLDVLFEMRPVAFLGDGAAPKFEVQGHGAGNKTIDWLVTPDRARLILLDVKHRVRDLVDHLKQIMAGMESGIDPSGLVPKAPNPEFLFKDTEEKFVARPRQEILQGAWISASIKMDRTSLLSYFHDRLDREKVHFAILSGWEKKACLLFRDPADKSYLTEVFQLVESDQFVCSNYADSRPAE